MKNNLTIIILLLNLTVVFGQTNPNTKKGDGLLNVLNILNDGLNTYNKAKNGNSNPNNGELSNGGMTKSNKQWSEWRSCPSFKKIQYSIIYDEPFDASKNIHYWRIRIKNNYSVPVYGGFSFGTSINDLNNNYLYGVNDGFKGGQLTIYLNAYEVSSNNEIRIKSSTNLVVDVVDLGYSPEGGRLKLRTDGGDFCMRCKLYPSENGCE